MVGVGVGEQVVDAVCARLVVAPLSGLVLLLVLLDIWREKVPVEVWLELMVVVLVVLSAVVQVVVDVVKMLDEVEVKFGPSSIRVRLGTVRFGVHGLGRGQRTVLLRTFGGQQVAASIHGRAEAGGGGGSAVWEVRVAGEARQRRCYGRTTRRHTGRIGPVRPGPQALRGFPHTHPQRVSRSFLLGLDPGEPRVHPSEPEENTHTHTVTHNRTTPLLEKKLVLDE